jgi:hypothetical protein
MEIYQVTFQKNLKYQPTIQTVEVKTNSEYNARLIVNQTYGSIKKKGVFSDKITILSIKKIDNFTNNKKE